MFRALLDGAMDTSDIQLQALSCLILVVCPIGLLYSLSLLGKVAQFCWRQFLRPSKNPKQYGEWAIVTGSTDGIGREYCNFLAKAGELICQNKTLLQSFSFSQAQQIPEIIDSTL